MRSTSVASERTRSRPRRTRSSRSTSSTWSGTRRSSRRSAAATPASARTPSASFGVPAVGGKPAVVLDFATSELALGKVRVARQRGERVRAGVLIDAQGRPTTDPAVMYEDPRGALLPFGLHKGYGLAFVCELLAGALAGGGTIATVPSAPDQALNGMLSFVVDPRRLPGADRLADEIATVIDHVKASPPADPSLPVLVAGEPELEHRAERVAHGIPVERPTWDQLR